MLDTTFDQKNPRAKPELEHLAPEELVKAMVAAEERISAITTEIDRVVSQLE